MARKQAHRRDGIYERKTGLVFGEVGRMHRDAGVESRFDVPTLEGLKPHSSRKAQG